MRLLALALALLVSPAHAQNTFFAGSPGDMIYRGNTGWAAVPGGTGGCPLVSNGPTAAASWQCDLSGSPTLRLPSIPTNRVLGNVTGTQTYPRPIDINQLLDTVGYDTLRPPPPGSIISKSSTTRTWQAIPATAPLGWVLTSQGPGISPQFVPNNTTPIVPGAAGTCLVSNGISVNPSYQNCQPASPLAIGQLTINGATNLGQVLIGMRSDAVNASATYFASVTMQNLTTGPTDSVFQEAYAFQDVITGTPAVDIWARQLDPNHERKEWMVDKYRGDLIVQYGRNPPVNARIPSNQLGVTFFTGLFSQCAGCGTALTLESTIAASNIGLIWDTHTLPGTGGIIWGLTARGSDLAGALTLRNQTTNNDIWTVDPSSGAFTLYAGMSIQSGSNPLLVYQNTNIGATTTVQLTNTTQIWDLQMRSDLSQAFALRDQTNNVDKITAAINTGDITLNGSIINPKKTASASAPGAANIKIESVCGTAGGTAKIIAYAGTSATPTTILDNIGAGVSGC